MLWMLRQAHAVHRDDVPVITVIRALAMAGVGVSGLLLAPEIVRCVEEGASLSRLLTTIAVLTGALLVCSAVRDYLHHGPLFSRVDVRLAIIRKIHYKACVMAYPLTEDPEVLKLQERAARATCNNRSASESDLAGRAEVSHRGAELCGVSAAAHEIRARGFSPRSP